MRVINYAAHNVKGCRDIKFDLEGHHLFIVGGGNGNGKTSAIDALLMAICRPSGMGKDYPSPALREGEKEGWVRVNLTGDEELHDEDGFVVELELKRRRNKTVKETIRLLDSTGEEAAEPAKTLRRLYQNKAFDPLAFDKLSKRDRRETLMQLVGLDLSEFKKDHKKLYDERTHVNRDVETAKARYEAMEHFGDAPKKPIVVDELMKELESTQAHNRSVVAAMDAMGMADKGQAIASAEVKDLEAKLKQAKTVEKEAKKAFQDAIKAREALGDEKDTESITESIRSAGIHNEKLAANQRKEAAKKEWSDIDDRSAELSEQIKDLEEAQDKKLSEAEWPVPGMSVDDEGVLLDGLPIESACKSKRIVASTRVGMSLNPKLRLLVCEDGSDLDADTLKELDALLKENDFQMIVEVVTRNPQDEQMCAVVISDGMVKEKDTEAEATVAS